jgi:hypothetical protein
MYQNLDIQRRQGFLNREKKKLVDTVTDLFNASSQFTTRPRFRHERVLNRYTLTITHIDTKPTLLFT